MTDQTQEYEKRLLTEPFDHALRTEFADYLVSIESYPEAVRQYELVLGANKQDPQLSNRLALALLKNDKPKEALEQYMSLAEHDDYVQVEELEKLKRGAQSVSADLAVVDGRGSENVVSIYNTEVEKVRFADVAGMQKLKKLLRLQIIEPFRNPGLFSKFRKSAGGGVLLYGPPGCGKTLIARAIATECKANFILIGISDVLSMWIGESEQNLAALFEQARQQRPTVMFFDELDALAFSRSKLTSSSSRTVVNEFLSQLDGFNADNKDILVLAATNMPWDVDSAMKRPGRFSRQVFVPPPDAEAREEMLRNKLTGVPATGINVRALAEKTHHFSGADIDGLIDGAKESALSEILDTGNERNLLMSDFAEALEDMTPSTIDWLKTARNLVKFAGADASYKDVEKYLKASKLY